MFKPTEEIAMCVCAGGKEHPDLRIIVDNAIRRSNNKRSIVYEKNLKNSIARRIAYYSKLDTTSTGDATSMENN